MWLKKRQRKQNQSYFFYNFSTYCNFVTTWIFDVNTKSNGLFPYLIFNIYTWNSVIAIVVMHVDTLLIVNRLN